MASISSYQGPFALFPERGERASLKTAFSLVSITQGARVEIRDDQHIQILIHRNFISFCLIFVQKKQLN